MTDREKLIELLGEDTCHRDGCYDCDYDGDRDACIEYLKNSMADHLLANGVTFQKWIPVPERLPEDGEVVLVWCKIGKMFVGYRRRLYSDNFYWYILTARDSTKHITYKVTHWMPLPNPPEE